MKLGLKTERRNRGVLSASGSRARDDRFAWRALPGPQTQALESQADILFYGGAAGGGKTDLLLGAAKGHHRSVIFRRVFPNLRAVIDRSREMYNPDGAPNDEDSFNESLHRWRFGDGSQVHFAALQHQSDATKYQGQPYSFYGFDEITEFPEKAVRFVIGWNRSTRRDPLTGAREHCRVIFTGNPPTTQEGEWVIRFFAPWLDPTHPDPAEPGELRWFAVIGGKDIAVDGPEEFVLVDGDELKFKFDRSKYKPHEIIKPKSRTFIPARLHDNPYLADTGYAATVQAMPEPWRTQMLTGDFTVGLDEDTCQVLPTAWVEAAMRRWREADHGYEESRPMTALGVDVARGGKDNTVISPRHGAYFARQVCIPGVLTKTGDAVAAEVVKIRSSAGCRVNIDVIGVGSSPYDCLRKMMRDQAVPMHSSEKSEAQDKTQTFGFLNQRAEWWWKLREALDPMSGEDLMIPDDSELKSDLCATRFEPCTKGIKAESKDDVKDRLGRSPDRGDSLVYAHATKFVDGAGYIEYYRRQAEEASREREATREQEQQERGSPWHRTR